MKVRRIVTAGAAALAAGGLLGMVPAAAQASSAAVPNWSKQTPEASPSARFDEAMAYDAATGTVVMFGGRGPHTTYGDTWTWDGTTWTEQHPATHPSPRTDAAMAYDAATGSVVLFGGSGGLADTWTWDGTNWTRQHPGSHPSARSNAGMAYDAATGNVVLFGGRGSQGYVNYTWTWDGTTWTRHSPAASPPEQVPALMTYDAATGNIVMIAATQTLDTMWTWDGTTWTQLPPPASTPPVRGGGSMAYDAATGNVVLFGGLNLTVDPPTCFNDTWAWDGTTWTQQSPTTNPPRRQLAGMTYDGATGAVVLFSGRRASGSLLDDTWSWG